MVQETFAQSQILTTVIIATSLAAVGIGYAYYLRKKKNEVPKRWTKVGRVKHLYLYPLKSGRRRELQTAECTPLGIRIRENNIELRDRNFIVYGQNEIKTARTFPKMVLIETHTNANGEVIFTAPGQDPLIVKFPIVETDPIKVVLFGRETLETFDCGDEAASWLSEYILDKPSGVRLGYHSSNNYRRNVANGKPVFKAAYPLMNNYTKVLYQDMTGYLLMNQASVDELNKKIGNNQTKHTNFRPTILIEGPEAYAEEKWDWFMIGDVVLRNVKPCTRCVFTTIDPESGMFQKGREPLTTLVETNNLKKAAHIKAEGKIGVMGAMLMAEKLGYISVGDDVHVA